MMPNLRDALPWLILLLLVSLLYFSGLYPVLRLPLESFDARNLYTLFTAHWVHINFTHYLHNALALVIVMLLLAPAFTWRGWLMTCVLTSLLISLLLLLWPPGVGNYAGLSGMLHGLLVTGAIGLWREAKPLALILLLLLAGKLLAEFVFDLQLLHNADFAVVKHAHLYGVLGGLLSAALIHAARKRADQ